MISTLRIALCTAILLVGVCPSLIVAQEPTPVVAPSVAPTMPKAPTQWEYLVQTESELLKELGDTKQELPSAEAKTSAALSAQGSKGWELVTVITQPYYHDGAKIISTVRYVFKRAK